MTFEVRPFDPQHLRDYAETAAELWIRPLIERLDPDTIQTTGLEWSGFWNGRLIGTAGYVRIYPGSDMRAMAWAILTPMPKEAFVKAHWAVKRSLDEAPFTRIEAHVDYRLQPAHRWVRALG